MMHCAFWQGQAELSPAREKKGSKVYTVDGRIPGAEQQMEVAEWGKKQKEGGRYTGNSAKHHGIMHNIILEAVSPY